MNKYFAVITVNGNRKTQLFKAENITAATQKSINYLNETYGDGHWVYVVQPTRVGR